MKILLKSECTNAIYTWIGQHEFLTWHLGGVHVRVFARLLQRKFPHRRKETMVDQQSSKPKYQHNPGRTSNLQSLAIARPSQFTTPTFVNPAFCAIAKNAAT